MIRRILLNARRLNVCRTSSRTLGNLHPPNEAPGKYFLEKFDFWNFNTPYKILNAGPSANAFYGNTIHKIVWILVPDIGLGAVPKKFLRKIFIFRNAAGTSVISMSKTWFERIGIYFQ